MNDACHGFRMPNEAFFIEIPNFWAWTDKLANKFWGIWRIVGQIFGMFSSIQPLFLQKLSLFNFNLGRKELGI